MPVDFFAGQRQMATWGSRINTFLGAAVFKKTLACVVALMAYTALGDAIQHALHRDIIVPSGGQALFGAALTILLVLRTNSSYDRWWEARKLWGQLVNDSRNLALKVSSMADVPPAEKQHVARLIVGFARCLKEHLRRGVLEETLEQLPEKVPERIHHVPAYLSGRLFEIVRGWRDQGTLHRLDHHLMDKHISALMDICGACERIRNTPLPLSHRTLIPQLLAVYLAFLPVGLENSHWNVLMVGAVGYFLIGLELVADDIEEPFGHDLDDLPLDRIADNIERSVVEITSSGADVALG